MAFSRSENNPGRVGGGVAPAASHRSGLAQLRHPARPVADSHALRYPWSFRGQLTEVQCPRAVARPRPRDEAPPSLHRVLAARVPRLPRYYEALRFPAALPDTLRFLRMMVTRPSRLCSFLLPSPTPTWGREVLGLALSQGQMLKSWRRQGVPSSWGTLLCLRPVLRPRQEQRHQARMVG
jgi:hypothetical protein